MCQMSLATKRYISEAEGQGYGEFAKQLHFPHRMGQVNESAGRTQETFTQRVLECPLV